MNTSSLIRSENSAVVWYKTHTCEVLHTTLEVLGTFSSRGFSLGKMIVFASNSYTKGFFPSSNYQVDSLSYWQIVLIQAQAPFSFLFFLFIAFFSSSLYIFSSSCSDFLTWFLVFPCFTLCLFRFLQFVDQCLFLHLVFVSPFPLLFFLSPSASIQEFLDFYTQCVLEHCRNSHSHSF